MLGFCTLSRWTCTRLIHGWVINRYEWDVKKQKTSLPKRNHRMWMAITSTQLKKKTVLPFALFDCQTYRAFLTKTFYCYYFHSKATKKSKTEKYWKFYSIRKWSRPGTHFICFEKKNFWNSCCVCVTQIQCLFDWQRCISIDLFVVRLPALN